ncbi:hypothetical protein AB4212_12145, partial [Streptomyces sp. 2MCAF27]
ERREQLAALVRPRHPAIEVYQPGVLHPLDVLELLFGGGCPVCELEGDEMCVGCGRCNCDRHETCVRPDEQQLGGAA